MSDIRLPDVDGPEPMVRVPATWQARPWIGIAGDGTRAPREASPERGAADLFTKPLGMDRPIRRLRALQPQTRTTNDPTLGNR